MLEAQLIRLDGTVVDVEGVAGPFLYDGKLATQLVIREITERKEAAERLSYLAQYDSLTGLPNRSLFRDRLEHTLAQAKRNGQLAAVLFIDLDRFKIVNDSLGHAFGDTLLQQVAARLSECIRADDTVGRFGGDEFGVILLDLAKPADAAVVARKINDTLARPFDLDGQSTFISASVGITLYPTDAIDPGILTINADAAMYRAKELGRNTYQFFTQEMNDRAMQRMQMEASMRQALERREFVLHYQPKVNLASGKLAGVEALIRWNDPRTGLVPPGSFIPVLEETGLINEVGRRAVRQAIEDYLRWRAAGLPAVRVAVNVSSLQLRSPGFVDEIREAVSIDAHAAAGLELEITESLIMEDVKHNIASLQAIRAMGVTIAIDDFGTGFSSLSYLAKLPVDTLKIDRSFVIDMTTGPEGLGLVSTIITLAHSLKLKVVAEGVETEEQSRLLHLLSCDEMQGFLFSKPVPVEIFEKKFLTRSPNPVTRIELPSLR